MSLAAQQPTLVSRKSPSIGFGRCSETRVRAPDILGVVDKFELVSGGGEMDHSEEAVGQLIVSGSDCAVDL